MTDKAKDPATLGSALVADGIVTEEQLERAVRIQKRLEERKNLGEVLADLGYAKKQVINEAIARHGGALRIGDMLVEQGLITPEALTQGLRVQREQGILLGTALVQLGAVNERTLLQNIANQARVPFIEPSHAMVEPTLLQGISPDYLKSHRFVPFSKDAEGRTMIVVPDLKDDAIRQAVRDLFHEDVVFALGPEDAILQTIEDFHRFRRRTEGRDERGATTGEEVVVTLVNHLLSQAIDEGASDVHIEPMSDKIRVRFRIDGVLVYKTDLPSDLLPKILSRIKIMADCNITEHQRHQGGRILYPYEDKELDMRVSIYVTIHGQSVVLRVLNKDLALLSLDELGMTPSMMERFRRDVLDVPTGVVLITGPTGSGKTTTLYSCIDYSNDVSTKIITAEDPAEFTIEGIIQCSIYDKVGRTFEHTLREIVRQDPDIIVLGEIRDPVSAKVAIQAALTGHKVYSTFHTEDTIGGLLRLIDMEIETFLISSTLISVVAQRLLRRICPKCSVPHVPTGREIQMVGLKTDEVREHEYLRGQGCAHCAYTGYRGRVAVYELLVLNELVKEAILQKKPAHAIRQISMETTGLVSMREDAVAKVIAGTTTFEEVLKRTPRTYAMRSLRQIIALCM
jgi:type IV pilus assembly protein PilB